MNKRIVFVACAIACNTNADPPPEPMIHSNPPPTPPVNRNPPSPQPVVVPALTTNPMAPVEFTGETFRGVGGPSLNPKVDGKTTYKSTDQTCFVYGQFPADEPPPIPGMSPPQVPVECPPGMSDAVYDLCHHGTVYEARGECGCVVMGNPPPPARALSRCPAVTIQEPSE